MRYSDISIIFMGKLSPFLDLPLGLFCIPFEYTASAWPSGFMQLGQVSARVNVSCSRTHKRYAIENFLIDYLHLHASG